MHKSQRHESEDRPRSEPDEGLSILIVEDDEAMREAVCARLESWGHRVFGTADVESALDQVRLSPPDLVLSDVVLPGASGLDLLGRLGRDGEKIPVVLMTAHAEVDLAVEAMKKGALDFLTKPIEADHLRSLVDAIGSDVRAKANVRRLDSRLSSGRGPARLVGGSDAMREIFELIGLLATNDASAIIDGESGTGKELVARSIHELSAREGKPFVALNCAAIPAGLMESELFGHVRGAFTGAVKDRPGCFELADGGVLFLDEIAEMPMDLQPKLLRVLEEGMARRVGGSASIGFDVRVLAATNRDPRAAIRDGRLREDLYYRLAVFQINLPPLRRRTGDIPLLAHAFVKEANRKHGCGVEGVREEALEAMNAYDWPGNVRELRNVVERSVIVAGSGFIEPSHLPPFLRQLDTDVGSDEVITLALGTPAREAEKMLILETLAHVGYNKAEAARRLELDVKTIRNKLAVYEAEDPGSR
ncbi:MAG: sigma-54 dependent transcriptional regulator [Gemmatimonadota bacterium]